MSNASTRLAAGFEKLLTENGETVTFRDEEITVLVSRQDPKPQPDGRQDFETTSMSVVEIRPADITGAPDAGESLVDEFGYRHRIQKARRLPHVWRCTCHTSETSE